MLGSFRTWCRVAPIAAALVCRLAVGGFIDEARADEVGAGYDPPVGSHWLISTQESEDKVQEGRTTTTGHTREEELTILEKTATGFRADFVIRKYGVTGSDRAAAMEEALFGAIQNVVIHAELDQAGKPARIDNFTDIKGAAEKGVERMVAMIDDPDMKGKIREALEATLAGTADDAADKYLDTLSLLAVAQDTGLKLGEDRHSSKETQSPLGGDPIKINSVLRLAEADPGGSKVTVTRDETFDPDTLKTAVTAFVKKLGLGEGSAEFEKMLNEVTVSTEEHTEFKVEQGMTRTVSQDSVLKMAALGHSATKHDQKTITVAPVR